MDDRGSEGQSIMGCANIVHVHGKHLRILNQQVKSNHIFEFYNMFRRLPGQAVIRPLESSALNRLIISLSLGRGTRETTQVLLEEVFF